MTSYEFFIETERKYIDFINKIVEGHEDIGIVRTLDPNMGIIKIISTSDFVEEVRDVVRVLNERGVPAKITKEGPWEGTL